MAGGEEISAAVVEAGAAAAYVQSATFRSQLTKSFNRIGTGLSVLTETPLLLNESEVGAAASETDALLGSSRRDVEAGEGDGPGRPQLKPLRQRRTSLWQLKPEVWEEKQPLIENHPSFNPETRAFYERQKELLAAFQDMDRLERQGEPSENEAAEAAKEEIYTKIAIVCSNVANVVLLLAKTYASVRSGSLAIIASTLDSLLDLISGFILWFTAIQMQRHNPYMYPVGNKRMQPVGIIVFAAIMATLGFQILLEGVVQLVAEERRAPMSTEQQLWLVGIMGAVTLVKLGLFLYCRAAKSEIVQAYAQDHFFDVITNVGGLVAALLAERYGWWIDPVGAIILALYTVLNWGGMLMENALSLVGQTAPPELLQRLTYLVYNHHRAIKAIDTVRAYTFGSLYFVEVEIELPEEMPLRQAHDIGESLHFKLEALPEVERAFVHLNYVGASPWTPRSALLEASQSASVHSAPV